MLDIILAAEGGDIDPIAGSISTVQVASMFIGIFIPILVGLVTKVTTAPLVKSMLLLGLAAISGFLTEFVNDPSFEWQQALLTSVVTFITGVAFYFGVWTPTGVTASVQAVGSKPKAE